MRSRFRQLLVNLTTGFWFIPSLLTVLSFMLAAALLRLDHDLRFSERYDDDSILFSSGEGAESLLSTIGGSVISVAGVLFSITILVLSTASAQFGPGLLGNFMRHRGTQVVLGVFVGTFTYCLVVLRFVDVQGGFVPHLAVNVGLLLGLTSFFLLIYFIHHVAMFIRVANVIDDVALQMETVLNDFFPEADKEQETPDDEKHSALAEQVDAAGAVIGVRSPGYLQLVIDEELVAMANKRDLVICLHHRPGHFLVTGAALAAVMPAESLDDDIIDCIGKCSVTGTERTIEQDPEYAVQQLVEIAVRALSTGVNDPFTAITCLNRLASALASLASRRLPSRYLRDEQGEVRVLLQPLTYSGVVEAAFNQLRQNAVGNAAVIFRLLEILAELGKLELPVPFREALKAQLDAVRAQNDNAFDNRMDEQGYAKRVERAQAVLS